jgi:LysM repeat protein
MKTLKVRSIVTFVLLAILLAAVLAINPASAIAASQSSRALQAVAPAQSGCTYTVRPGETLYSIAMRYGTTVYYLAQSNSLYNPNWIYAGMRLRVPCGGVTYPPGHGDGFPPSGICNYYTVQRGDWLAVIAARFGTTWQAIAQANRLYNPNFIYAGMRLAIPCGNGSPPPGGQSQSYVSLLYHYAVKSPAGWTFKINTSVPSGPGLSPEYVTFSAPGRSLPQIEIDVLTGAPPFTGFENCVKNLTFRGIPACSLSLPAGQNPALRLLIFQKGNAHFHIGMYYQDEGSLAIWDSFLATFNFTN